MVVGIPSRPLVTFSILSLVYQQQEKQEKQQDFKKKKITIKPKVIQDTPAPAPASAPAPAPAQQQKQKQRENENEKHQEVNPKKKITIVKRRFKNSDIAPPTTMYFIPKNDLYTTPPPKCCRFFIENKHCFLREKDNACICPTSKNVIGFWNEKVGNECKLLPVEDETTYEQADAIASANNTFVEKAPEEAQLQSKPKPNSESPTSPIPKPKFVSDAQRARIASEPVALLRAKLAKQYGMVAKKN